MKLAPLALVVFVASSAHADSQTEAEALYDQGMQDLGARNFEKACPELAASLAKHADIATQAALAECDTQLGKVASAWKLWRELARSAPSADLKAEAGANAKKLEPRVPHVAIKPPAVQPAGLAITINGERVAMPSVELVVDPGTMVAGATAPGFVAWTQTYPVTAGATLEVVVPALAAQPAAPVQPTSPTTPSTTPSPVAAAAAPGDRTKLALAFGIGGGVSLVGGLGFGLHARSQWNDALANCNGAANRCYESRFEAAKSDESSARQSALVSDVLMGIGIAAIATGAILYLRAPTDRAARSEHASRSWRVLPVIRASSAGLSLSGALE